MGVEVDGLGVGGAGLGASPMSESDLESRWLILDVSGVGFRSPGGPGLGSVGRGLAWNSQSLTT